MPTPQNISGLLFDMGGVVFEIDFNRAIQTWSQWTHLPIEEIQVRFKMDHKYAQHERGEIGASEYFSHLRSVLELEADDAEIASGWNAIYMEEIAETVNYILAVKEKYPCFAFTNSNPTHQSFWEAAYPRAVGSFHKIFVSSELGLRKPDCEAFEAISDSTGIRLDEMLFFDDTEENVNGARAVGMQSILVKAHIDVKKALVDLGAL